MHLTIYATGMHFSRNHGFTIDEVRATDLADKIVEVPCGETDDSSAGTAIAIGRGVKAFAKVFEEQPPDVLVILGDRFDALPAALAALPFNVPVAHISGGDITEGVIDDSIRHALTKFSHLHFPAHETAARNIIQMGEEPWRVIIVGEPGLDTLEDFPFEGRKTVFDRLGLKVDQPVTAFTFHPETLATEHCHRDIGMILAAAKQMESQIVFTYPNADTGSGDIIDAIETYTDSNDGCSCHASLGREGYLNLLRHADCMVGNSSSGIVEAAWFELPVINIGNRQHGRVMPRNVINVPANTEAIVKAWVKALGPEFRQGLNGLKNPYGDGHAAGRIVQSLKSLDLGNALITKRFQHTLDPVHADSIA